jgi:hypothetical protein
VIAGMVKLARFQGAPEVTPGKNQVVTPTSSCFDYGPQVVSQMNSETFSCNETHMVSSDINNQYALNPISTFKLSDGEIIHSEIRESKELRRANCGSSRRPGGNTSPLDIWEIQCFQLSLKTIQ